MTDADYLLHINKFASLLMEFKESVNAIKDNWASETGYGYPSGVVSLNAAIRNILNDLDTEAEDVESFIEVAAAGKLEVM